MVPGEGLVGHVWNIGQPSWAEDFATDANFLRRQSAREYGLRWGGVFSVSYVTDDPQRHSLGVLEFFSSLSRQRDAQLPTNCRR